MIPGFVPILICPSDHKDFIKVQRLALHGFFGYLRLTAMCEFHKRNAFLREEQDLFYLAPQSKMVV